jgi:hypothetical protein
MIEPKKIGSRIEEIRFEHAADLLGALNLHSGIWGENPNNWVFRGHADAKYFLLPSAHRAESWNAFGGPFDPSIASEAERVTREATVLARFLRTADAAGLPVPINGDLELWWRFLMMPRNQPNLNWPRREDLPLMALAQHYGIPTRLLDWTRNNRTAAYFAALEPRGVPADDLAVWAINGQFIIACMRHLRGASACSLNVVPRSGNPNLHAQWGLFTWRESDSHEELLTLDELVDRTLSGRIEARKDGELWIRFAPETHTCLLRKMVLSRGKAKDLMQLLHLEGVSAASVFPGFAGAAEQVREQFWCSIELGEF